MPLEIAFAAGMLTSLLSAGPIEGAKLFISDLWNADKNLSELRGTLEKELCELRKTLKNFDASISHYSLPSDWLDELENFWYEIEDMEDSLDLAYKKKFATKFLETNLNRVRSMQINLTRKQDDVKPGQSSRQNNSEQDDGVPAAGDFFTRGKEKEKIIEELTTKGSFGVSIIGICGIGKTTLAKAIENEVSIKNYFPHILFHSQSPTFSSGCAIQYIKDNLPSKDQRVLTISDDVHSMTQTCWDRFMFHFQTIFNPESRVLITTQNPEVANIAGTSKHCLHPLSKDDCFTLIQNLANKKQNLDSRDKESIQYNKNDLVDKCKGLPLLANQIGVLLLGAQEGKRHEKIKEIKAGGLCKVSDLLKVLLNRKPVTLLEQEPHLRRCMAYCSLFPQDHDFKEHNLIQFWMAEGFTQLSSPTTDVGYLYETSREYFQNLLSCSIFQTSEMPPDEEPRYKMHGLAYDLAQNVASNTFCRKHIGKSTPSLLSGEFSNITRHVSFSGRGTEHKNDISRHLLRIETTCKDLRTFLLFQGIGKNIPKNPTFYQRLELLRVLDLNNTNLTKLEPKNISKLKHLCYLDLSHTAIELLPKFSKIPALQVLKLKKCYKLLSLPKDLAKLTSLVSLYIDIRGLGSMPPNIGELKNLQRLDMFIVGDKEGLKIAELKNLNKLQKSLRITRLENVKTKEDAEEAELHNKCMLYRLELEWSRLTNNRSSLAEDENAKQVLEGLQPPKDIEKLIVRNYNGSEFPEWFSNTQCGMLNFIHFDRCKVIPALDHLSKLQTLHIEAMHVIPNWGEPSGLGLKLKLKLLVLSDMPEPMLEEWINLAATHMPHLQHLRFEKCDSLLKLPALDSLVSLEKLQISCCTKLKELDPQLPTTLKDLIIEDSEILKEHVGKADHWIKSTGIKVETNTTEHH